MLFAPKFSAVSLIYLWQVNIIIWFLFEYSFKYLLHKKIIENKINLIEIYGNVDLNHLQEDLINYMKGRLEC